MVRAMPRRSTAWKNLERTTAEVLGGERVTTHWTLFEVRDDVRLPDFPLRIDAKYRRRWLHNTMLREIEQKYCRGNEAALLVAKSAGERGATVTCRLDYFAELLGEIRRLRSQGSGLECPRIDKPDNGRGIGPLTTQRPTQKETP